MIKRLTFLLPLFFMVAMVYGQQWGNKTLYSLQNGSSTFLMDTNGTVTKTWTHGPTAKTGYSSYLMPGGVLWRSVSNQGNQLMGGGMTGRIQKVDFNGNVLWDFVYSSSTYCLHHDFCPLPNGNVLMISYDVHTAVEANAAGASQSIVVWSDKIIEVQPTGATTGTIVWEWRAWDHLVQNVNPAKANYQTSIVQHPERLNINYKLTKDWMHMNGVDYNPITDQVAFSSHNLNEWYLIDHSTTTTEAASTSGGNSGKGGDILYRWGNPAAYQAGGTAILNVTHDVHWIPEEYVNAGRLVGFNNGGITSPSNKSAVDQIDVPSNGYLFDQTAGQAFGPASYTQRLACNGYTTNMGSSEQLPNGNSLVCIALSGLIYETNPAGTTIWSKNVGGTSPQAHRYSDCYLSAPPHVIPTISQNGAELSASVAATYQWYRNGLQIAGATSQNYTPTSTGIYLVRVTYTGGCEYLYDYSKGLKITIAQPLSVAVSAVSASVCAGSTVQLNASATGGQETTSYFWTSEPAGFISTLPNPAPIPTVSTVYKLVATNGLEKDSGTVSVQVNPLPATPVISQNTNDLTASQGATYAWWLGGSLVPALTTQTISATTSGSYQVQITDANGCLSALSDPFNFVYTNTNGLVTRDRFSIFPNPSNGVFHIKGIDPNTTVFMVMVVDGVGKTVFSGSCTEIDLTDFPQGVYRIRIQNKSGDTASFNIHKI